MSGRFLVILIVIGALLASVAFYVVLTRSTIDPLPSWQDGSAKQHIVEYVRRVTAKGGRDYVPPEHRVATFDNDGTLWSEQPLYFQLQFALDRVKALAPEHPEWKEQIFEKWEKHKGEMRVLLNAADKKVNELERERLRLEFGLVEATLEHKLGGNDGPKSE